MVHKKGSLSVLELKPVKYLIEIVLIGIGFGMILFQINNQVWAMGDNVWNSRLFGFSAIILIAIGFAFPGSDWEERLVRFFVAFGVITSLWFTLGGYLLTNDTLNGTNYSGGSVWVAFDLFGGWGTELLFAAQSLPYIVAVAILVMTVIMVFYVDSDELATAIIEGLLNFGFLALFMFISNYFGLI